MPTTKFTMSLLDKTNVAFVYEAIDPETGVVFYVGRTVDLTRRAGEHDRSKYKIRELLKLKNFRFRDIVRPVPELPHGCHPQDAAELESYFIFNRQSIYDPVTNPFGCNSKLGDYATDMSTARYYELTAMLTVGYEWPTAECVAPEAVSTDLATARGVETVIDEMIKDARIDGDTEAVEALEAHAVLAKFERLGIERDWYGVRAFGELVLGNYKRNFVDAVDLNTLTSELNILKDKLKDDPEYEDLAGVITALGLVAHPDKARKVSSAAAVGFLEGVVAMIGTREEEQLKWTHDDVRKNIYNVRQWTRVNGMEKPKQTTSCATENSLAGFLHGWKSPRKEQYGGKCTDLASCDVVMRDVSWWPGVVGSKAKHTNDFKTLNAQLLDGYSHKDEPDFVGKKGLVKCGGGNRTVYDKLQNLVTRGTGTPVDVELVLAGLPEPRAKWYRDRYNAKREPRLAQMKVRSEALKKKRKLDNLGSTSALPEADADDDEADAYDDDDESDEADADGLE